MNKNKKLIADLRTYLGKDKDGLEKLDKISRGMVALNKDLIAEREANQRLRDALVVRQEQIDKLNSTILDMQQAADKTNARIVQTDRHIDALGKQMGDMARRIRVLDPDLSFDPVDEPKDDEEDATTATSNQSLRFCAGVFNELKKDVPCLPNGDVKYFCTRTSVAGKDVYIPYKMSQHPDDFSNKQKSGIGTSKGSCGIYDLQDLFGSYIGRSDLMTIGRLVFVTAMLGLSVSFVAPVTILELYEDGKVSEKKYHHYLKWATRGSMIEEGDFSDRFLSKNLLDAHLKVRS